MLDGYSKNATESQAVESTNPWKAIIGRFLTRIVIYSVVLIALIVVCRTYLMPFMLNWLGNGNWGRLAAALTSLALIAPLLISIMMPTVKRSEHDLLVKVSGNVSLVPIVVMTIVSIILATMFTAFLMQGVYHSGAAVLIAVAAVIVILMSVALFPTPLRKRLTNLEKQFISNINERENRRTGRENNLVSDLHLAYMRVGNDCPFVGERLRDLDLRTRYGVNVAGIQRAGKQYAVPSGDMRIFPNDVLGVIATEEQIQRLLPLVEAQSVHADTTNMEIKFVHFAITGQSPIVGKKLEDTHLREDYGALLVAVQRGEDEYLSPTLDLTFKTGDILWIVGNPKQLAPLKGS